MLLLFALVFSACGETLYGDISIINTCTKDLENPPETIEVLVASALENSDKSDECLGDQTVELTLQKNGNYEGFYKIVVAHKPGFDSHAWRANALSIGCAAFGCDGPEQCHMIFNPENTSTPYVRGGTRKDLTVSCSCK